MPPMPMPTGPTLPAYGTPPYAEPAIGMGLGPMGLPGMDPALINGLPPPYTLPPYPPEPAYPGGNAPNEFLRSR
jgi:hypothetical protein